MTRVYGINSNQKQIKFVQPKYVTGNKLQFIFNNHFYLYFLCIHLKCCCIQSNYSTLTQSKNCVWCILISILHSEMSMDNASSHLLSNLRLY
jgi:hypothetical protein